MPHLPKPRRPLTDEQLSMVLSAVCAAGGGGPALCCQRRAAKIVTRSKFWREAIRHLVFEHAGCAPATEDMTDRRIADLAAILSLPPSELWESLNY